jgi:hypothetical protein
MLSLDGLYHHHHLQKNSSPRYHPNHQLLELNYLKDLPIRHFPISAEMVNDYN